MSSPVPTTSCQRATTSPRSSEPLRSASSTSCRADAYARSACARRSAAAASCSAARALHRARTAREAAQRAGQRPADQIRPRLSVHGERVEPAAHRERAPSCGSRPSSSAVSPTTSSTASIPLRAHHLAEVRRHLALGVVGDAVEHDRQRRPALARRREELPRHRVRVPRCSRHEEPGVRGRQQLCREGAVLGEHRVDVGCVEERQPGPRARRAATSSSVPGTASRRSPAAAWAGSGRPRTSACRPGGRRGPGRASWAGARPDGLTSAPTRLLTIVDFPAPVEPPTTIRTGASI